MRWFGNSKHLKEINMTYSEHFWFSFSLGVQFSKQAFFAFSHAVIPDIYTTSSTDGIQHLSKMMETQKNELLLKDLNTHISKLDEKYKRLRLNPILNPRKKYVQYKYNKK